MFFRITLSSLSLNLPNSIELVCFFSFSFEFFLFFLSYFLFLKVNSISNVGLEFTTPKIKRSRLYLLSQPGTPGLFSYSRIQLGGKLPPGEKKKCVT